MLFSISALLFFGLLAGWIFQKIKFPALFGMILAGILIGPYALNLLDDTILSISTELRRVALIIILIRAGLKLDFMELKKVGRPAILLCFLPACFEIAGTVIFAPYFLRVSYLDAAILGAVIAAVSPAVIVPRMIKLIDQNYGTKKGIPQMLLAGASVDDVFVLVLFTTFINMAQGEAISWTRLIKIPISIILGILSGVIIGRLCILFFQKMRVPVVKQTLFFFIITFMLDWLEAACPAIPFSGLLAVMAVGAAARKQSPQIAVQLSAVFDRLWIPAEIFLFTLVGASIAIDSLKTAGLHAVALIFCVLLFRMVGVYFCMAATPFNRKEKIFCMLAYTPKATVQAAIGGLPLAMGLPCGSIILTVSVIAILTTAPLGAFAVDYTYSKLLEHNAAENTRSIF